MQATRTEILPGVWLSYLRTDKFKTACLSLNLLTTRITVTLAVYLVGLAIYLAVLANARMAEYDESMSIRKSFESKLRMMARRYEYRNRAERLQREGKRL